MSQDDNNQGFQLGIQRIYIKDLSFESPGVPAIFTKDVKPALDMNLEVKKTSLEQNAIEVALEVTVTAKNGDDTVFIAEIEQAGVFVVEAATGQVVPDQVLVPMCAQILFPYARETIDSLTVKGSFPPLNLAPVNFDAMMEQQSDSE